MLRGKLRNTNKQSRSLRGMPEASLSYEGRDSELFNYLDIYHKEKMCTKCVHFIIKI